MKNNNLDIGKLRHRIKLIDFVEEENELGALVKVEKVIKTIWARVEHKQGKEISLDDKIKNTETLLIKIRYFKDINLNMFQNLLNMYNVQIHINLCMMDGCTSLCIIYKNIYKEAIFYMASTKYIFIN